mgnify:CR=1 FL=1
MRKQKGEASRTVFDASPWGIGAALYRGGVPIAYFADAISIHDVKRYRHKVGDHRGQQVWESLALLVALKTWTAPLIGRRFSWRVTLKGDNVTALNLVLRMKAPAGALKAIAKEVAMVLSESPYRPASALHIPGLTNTLADALSRKFEPGETNWILPKELEDVTEVKLTTRTADYYTVDYTPRGTAG